MSEWVHSAQLPFGYECDVWLDGGSVRRVKADLAQGGAFFTDCTHPAQNVWCNTDRIKAWRLSDGTLMPPLSVDLIGLNRAAQAVYGGQPGWMASIFGLEGER